MDVVGIVGAIPAEGSVFRNAWGLKAVDAGPFRYYANEERVLVISGVGRVKCAAAVAWLLTRYPEIKNGVLINAGTAGSAGHAAGSIHLIRQVMDAATRKRLYPDILFAHPYHEATLHTVDAPVESLAEGIDTGDLVDMEGAAFLQAALLWLPCHRVQLIKAVSDNLSPGRVERSQIAKLMKNAVPAVEYVINAMPDGGTQKHTDTRMHIFSEIAQQWWLTATQTAQLRRAGRAWLLRHTDGDFAYPDDMEPPHDKQVRAKSLAVLLDRLWEG
jgi:nucleoside phosphorylase